MEESSSKTKIQLLKASFWRYVVAAMDDRLDQWFAEEILVHEPSLMRYLGRVWPNRDELQDLRQEVYVRVFEAAMRELPTSPKAFLFTSVRHLLIDRVRRNRIVFIGAQDDVDALNMLIDEVSPDQHVAALQELDALATAFDRLPPRCRHVMWLRKVERLSQRAVAQQLNVREGAVEKQVARGMRLLAKILLGDAGGDVRLEALEDARGYARSEGRHG